MIAKSKPGLLELLKLVRGRADNSVLLSLKVEGFESPHKFGEHIVSIKTWFFKYVSCDLVEL